MKAVMAAVLFLVMAAVACSTGPAGLADNPAMTGARAKTDQISVMAGDSATVMAERLNLRTLPDQAGPGDSVVKTVMAAGDKFQIDRCAKFQGQQWAFGTFVDKQGRSWQGWAAAAWLSAGACHD